MQMYGIPNCDTVKKAKKELEALGVEFDFVDFKKTPPTKKLISSAEKFLGEIPVNKRGTTFRKIREDFEGATKAQQINILMDNSSAIKRPILVDDSQNVICVGFKNGDYEQIL